MQKPDLHEAPTDLQPHDVLSQVVFVLDYEQLVFHDCRYTLFNKTKFEGPYPAERGTRGFADGLVSLIGKTATVIAFDDSGLRLDFGEAGAVVVGNSDTATGPESWTLMRLGRTIVVEQN
jgi:hypothetical protein